MALEAVCHCLLGAEFGVEAEAAHVLVTRSGKKREEGGGEWGKGGRGRIYFDCASAGDVDAAIVAAEVLVEHDCTHCGVAERVVGSSVVVVVRAACKYLVGVMVA